MKIVIKIALVLAVVSLILGLISRLTLSPIPIAAGSGLQAHAFLSFTDTCLLFAIALILMQIAKK